MRRLLVRCLKKDPKARLRDIGEAREEIEELLSGAPEEMATPAFIAPHQPHVGYVQRGRARCLGLWRARRSQGRCWCSRCRRRGAGQRGQHYSV